MKLKALRDEVLVKKIVKEETKGGIVLPESARKCTKAEVLSIGTMRDNNGKEIKSEVNVGDIVVFPSGTGQSLAEADDGLLMIKQEDILGILTEE